MPKVVRERKDACKISGQIFVEKDKRSLDVTASDLDYICGLDPGDQEVRAEMRNAAAVEYADRLVLGDRKKFRNEFVGGKR